jgi:soluble lytic murein transglycosylase
VVENPPPHVGGYGLVNQRWRRNGLISLLVIGAISFSILWWQWRVDRSQNRPIRIAAKRYDVEKALIKAVVWRESRFNPAVRGRAHEIGLMQLQEIAAQEWADAEHIDSFQHEHCFDAGTNVLAGTWYLKKLLKRYAKTDDPVPYALADFNAGRANVLKWNRGAAATNHTVFISQIGFPSTKAYVKAVIERRATYRMLAHIGWD